LADLGELPSQGRELPTQYPRPFRLTFFGKSHGEVAHSDLSQSHMQKINDPRQSDADSPGQGTWQNSKDSDERPGCRVLKSLPHRGKRDGTTVKNYLSNEQTPDS
jgi:hypothetical protein